MKEGALKSRAVPAESDAREKDVSSQNAQDAVKESAQTVQGTVQDGAVSAAQNTDGTENSRAQKWTRFRKKYFTASTIAKLAMLSALAFAVTFLEFPIFPPASFLKLDFANVFVLIGGFMYGPVAAVIISLIKECLCLLKSSTGGVGEIANFIVTFSFVIVPTLVYRFKKGLPIVAITLAIGCVLQIAAGLLSNRYINFPLFMGDGALAAFESLWWYVLLFNLIKGAAVSLVTILLYKRISWLLNKF